jgi:Lambda phage tail tape-measure protein (Tape_meas_lam_C)
MAKIADLIVQLSLDSATFKKGIDDSTRQIKRMNDDIAKGFQTLSSVVGLSLGTISASMAVDFVKSVAAGADEVGKLSQKIGVSVQDLSTLQHALKLSNVPTETFATGIGLLSKALAGMSDEQEGKGAPAALQALGISARDASGNLRPTIDILLEISDKFKGFADGAGKTNLALQLFGRSGKELIPFLNEGAAGIRAMQEEARALGLELTDKTAEAAQQFNDNLERLQAVSEGAAKQFTTGLLPSLNRLTDAFVEISKASDTAEGSISRNLGRNTGELLESLTKKWLGVGYAIREGKAWLDLTNEKFLEFIGLSDKGEVAQLAQELHNLRAGWEEVNGAMTKTVTLSQQLFGNSEQFAQGIELLNKQFPFPKTQPPDLPDSAALAKAAAAAKKYAEDYKRAFEEIQKITASGILAGADDVDAPFIKASQQLRENVDKITADLEKFPELAIKGPQRIGGLVAGSISDYLNQIDQLGDEAKKKIDEILGKSGELENGLKNIPIITPKTLPILDTSELGPFYARAVEQLKGFGTTAEKELEKIFKVDRIEQSIDELILRTGTAAQGIGVFFRQYAKYATDTAQVFHDAFARVFSALEDQLTNLLAHFKFDLKSFLDTVKESIARAVVQKEILGPLATALGKLGGPFKTIGDALKGPPDGTKDNPLYVIVKNGGGLFGGGLGGSSDSGDSGDSGDGEDSSGSLGKIQSGMGKIFSAIGSFFQKIGSAILSAFKFIGGAIAGLFGGFKADGGDVFSGKAYVVGERGPEIFAPGRSGTIIPNHALGAQRTANITINQYLAPTKSDPFGYSDSQLTNASANGMLRGLSRI